MAFFDTIRRRSASSRVLTSSPAKTEPDTSVKGIVGTPAMAGWLQDLGEYNPKLMPPTAFLTYEKMRRSDADVGAALKACKLPIRAADYQIVPGITQSDPGFARAKEIADFVKENLLGGLECEVLDPQGNPTGRKASQSLESVVENALRMLDFGCAAHEPIWVVDGGNWRLAHFGPRLASTFTQFVLAGDGELLYEIEQSGPTATGWDTKDVRADYLDFFSFDREGANWWGRSLLRTAYKHWCIKEQLERIDAIACERNGLGVPTIEQGPNASKEDREAAEAWVKNLSAHERTGVSLPSGWKFSLQGVTGTPRQILPSIRYHSEMIGRSVLATFLAYGTTQSGTRSLGESSTNFFKLSLEATAWLIAETMTNGSIRQLVRYNYGDVPKELYPSLVFANILATEPYELWNTVKTLIDGGVIQTDEELEAVAREDLGLPAKGTPRVQPKPPVDSGQKQTEKPGPGAQETGPGSEGQSELGAEVNSRAARRELKAWEQKVDYAALRRRQDTTARRVARILRQAKPATIKEAARVASQTPTLALQMLALPTDYNLVDQIAQVLMPAFNYGRTSVRMERQRATGRGPQQKSLALVEVKATVLAADRLAAAQNAPRLVAEAVISKFNNWVAPRAINTAINQRKRGLAGADLAAAVEASLEEMTDTGLDAIGMEAGRGALAGGRWATMADFAGEIARYVRSEADDQNTCEICDAADGTEWGSLEEVDWQPGDDCLGGDLCRGQLVAVWADEGLVRSE